MPVPTHGLYSYGLHVYVPTHVHSHVCAHVNNHANVPDTVQCEPGLYSHGLYSYGLCRYDLCSYGLYCARHRTVRAWPV